MFWEMFISDYYIWLNKLAVLLHAHALFLRFILFLLFYDSLDRLHAIYEGYL